MKRMLIIEDDANLMRGIAFAFERDGFCVEKAATLEEGRRHFRRNSFDIIILDIGLPDGSGLELCRSIREKSDVPVIMLTACDLETDEVCGLMAGADDYITKPFSLSVLRARAETVLRRFEPKANNITQSGVFTLDRRSRKLFKAGAEIPVSATEYKLVEFFISNAGQILSKEQILALWDNQGNFVDENTLPVNISRLRSKIENDPKNPETIKTVHGMGYIWHV